MAGIGTENLVSLNTLVFDSLEFLFWYLPVFLLVYYLVPDKWKNAVLFGGSLLLYGLGEPVYCFVLFGMSLVNFLFGRSLEAEGYFKKQIFLTAIACNVGLLVYFKGSAAWEDSFLMPIGISFYTFKSISYLTDVYWKKIGAERSFLQFGAYLCLFFQVVSGPVMRYDSFTKTFRGRAFLAERLEEGVKKLIFGLAAKVLIADRLGILWNDVQTIGFESISTPLAWLGMLAYSLQLYFDFAGYSLMAVGIGQMFGVPEIKNFEYPYASRSVSEFFRRWHITLGSWFRDYVYIPLGGSRKGKGRTAGNLMLVWLLTGIWHGASFNFICWGLVLGLLIVTEKQGLASFLNKHRLFSHIYVLLLIPLTWMIFAVDSVRDIGIYFMRLFPVFGDNAAVNRRDFYKELSIFAPTLAAGILLAIPAVGKWFEQKQNKIFVNIMLFFLFWLCVYQMSNAANNPFLYATF